MRPAAAGVALAIVMSSAAAAAQVRQLRADLGGVVTAVTLAEGELVASVLDAGGNARRWHIVLSDGRVVAEPAMALPEPPRMVDMLPDGVIVHGSGTVRQAWLAQPTRRYRHGVLGDDIEAGALVAEDAGGNLHRLVLDDDSVFEDRYPRLADVDGDGDADLVVVRSYLAAGAALAVYRLAAGGVEQLAESAPIGTPNRWLNPVGAADFDGDGAIELAAVVTPHLDGRLTIYRRDGDRVIAAHAVPGFSNHRIGSHELDLSAVADLLGDPAVEIVVPDASRRVLHVVSFAGGAFRELAVVKLPAELVTGIVVADIDADGRPELVYGLADGGLAVSVFAGEAGQ